MSTDRDVTFPQGSEVLRGHLTSPQLDKERGALLLIRDVYGLFHLHAEIAGRFADRGFTTLAIDLYTRQATPKLKSPVAMRWTARLSDPRVLGDLQAAIDYLAALDLRIGITGFCMGDLLAACSVHGVSARFSFYGMHRHAERNDGKPRSPLDDDADPSCPCLGIFGEDDSLLAARHVAELSERLAGAGKTFEIKSYPDGGHAFPNHARTDAYRPEATADAFERAVRFFEEHSSSDR
jgi:carboxymethylenebutenolidase